SLLAERIYSSSLIVSVGTGGGAVISGPSVPTGSHAVRAFIIDDYLRFASTEVTIQKCELHQPSLVVGHLGGETFAGQTTVCVKGSRGTVFTVLDGTGVIGTKTITDALETEVSLSRALVEDEIITVSDGVGF